MAGATRPAHFTAAVCFVGDVAADAAVAVSIGAEVPTDAGTSAGTATATASLASIFTTGCAAAAFCVMLPVQVMPLNAA